MGIQVSIWLIQSENWLPEKKILQKRNKTKLKGKKERGKIEPPPFFKSNDHESMTVSIYLFKAPNKVTARKELRKRPAAKKKERKKPSSADWIKLRISVPPQASHAQHQYQWVATGSSGIRAYGTPRLLSSTTARFCLLSSSLTQTISNNSSCLEARASDKRGEAAASKAFPPSSGS